MTRIFTLIMLLSFFGCSATMLRPDVEVSYSYGFTNKQVADINSSIMTHLNLWENSFGIKTRPVKIYVSSYRYLKDIGPNKTNIIGLYWPETNGEITVTCGEFLETPAVFHELCHRNAVSRFGMDPDHKDSKWSRWRYMGYYASEKSLKERK